MKIRRKSSILFKLSDIERKVCKHPDVLAVMERVRATYKSEIDKLNAELAQIDREAGQRRTRKLSTPRWPSECPEEVANLLIEAWRGTTDYGRVTVVMVDTDAKLAWVKTPGGSYWSGRAAHYGRVSYYLYDYSKPLRRFSDSVMHRDGKQSTHALKSIMDEIKAAR